MTILYSILHFLVDGVCAFAMFGRFLPQGNTAVTLILYNFCAFALQMPLGVILDYLELKSAAKGDAKTYSCITAAAGIVCTILGAAAHPVVLGIGNALFHVGGGVGTIHEDDSRNQKGRGLGIFVAPGALGLYLGTLAAKHDMDDTMLWIVCILMIILCAVTATMQTRFPIRSISSFVDNNMPGMTGQFPVNAMQSDFHETKNSRRKVYVAVCCLFVVILRSYIGMVVTFPWKTTILGGMLAVLAIVSGKVMGGFLSARYGILKTSVFSLIPAAIAYIGSSTMPSGLAALLLFNMTMPLTLYLLSRQFPQMPGFSFGLLTFGLFLGYLPQYFGLPLWTDGTIIGCIGSVLSLLILMAGIRWSSPTA